MNINLSYENCLLTDPYNIRFLTGFSGSQARLLKAGNNYFLFLDARYYEAWKKKVQGAEAVLIKKNFTEEITAFCRKKKIRVLYYEDYALSVKTHRQFTEKTGPEFIPMADESLRSHKTPGQIKDTEKALQIAEDGFLYILSFLKENIRELDIMIELEHYLRLKGSERHPFPAIIASGPNSSCPHHQTGMRRIETGDVLLFDFGAVYNGLCSDISRTVFFGKLKNSAARVAYERVNEAREQAFASIKNIPLPAKNVHTAADNVFSGYKQNKFFLHGTGHGTGYNIHEYPRLSSLSEDIIEEGSIFTIEPGLYYRGKFGIRIEDMAVIQKGQVRRMNITGTDLLVL